MPLANAIPREEVMIEGVLPDGTPYKDIYYLRGALGFYDNRNLLLAGMTVDDLKYFNKQRGNGATEIEDRRKLSAGTLLGERDLLILKTWVVGWSHDAPMTDENIREIPPDHSEAIIEKIKSMAEDARTSPFPGGAGDKRISGSDNQGEDTEQLDDLHPEGTGIEGPQLDADLPGPGPVVSVPDG